MHCYAPSFKEVERAYWFGPVRLSIDLPPSPHHPPPPPLTKKLFLDLDSLKKKIHSL